MVGQDLEDLDMVSMEVVGSDMGRQDLVGLDMVGQDSTVTEAKQDSSSEVKLSVNVHSPNWFHEMRSSFQVKSYFPQS